MYNLEVTEESYVEEDEDNNKKVVKIISSPPRKKPGLFKKLSSGHIQVNGPGMFN